MNVLSLFDGMSCCHLALDRVGIKVGKYYAAEIDKYAIKVTQHNYPDTIQLGSVTDWAKWDIDWSDIQLVTGGFPCCSWSMAGKQMGDKDERGKLFWTMLDIMQFALKHNPGMKFLIENVKMKKEFEEYITHHTKQALGEVDKILINSALVSAQNRNRYYWHNLGEIEQPEDKGILLKDILENGENTLYQRGRGNNAGGQRTGKSPCMGSSSWEQNVKVVESEFNYLNDLQISKLQDSESKGTGQTRILKHLKGFKRGYQVYDPCAKTGTICTAQGGGRGPHVLDQKGIRRLTAKECARLQTVPDEYIDVPALSNTQKYKMLGNGWTVDVIAHIFKNLTGEKQT